VRRGVDNRGFVKLILVLAILAGIAFVGISFGRPYYRYNTLRSHTKDLLYEELGNTQSIKEKVMADAAELNIPLKEEDLNVRIEGKKTVVKASWSEVVDFWGYYSKKLDFTIDEEY
jgi:hypothetical protein